MEHLKKIYKSEGTKIISINSLSVIIKIITGVVTSKFLALFIGPSGMALVGNFRNFSGILDSLTTLGFQNGIVKYTAENKDNNLQLQRLFGTLFLIVSIISLLCGIILFLFSDYWNELIFSSDYHFEIVFKIVAFLVPINVFGTYLVAIVNGFGNYKAVISINIIGNLISLFATAFLVYYLGNLGAILSILFVSATLFFIAIFYLPKSLFKAVKNFFVLDFSIIRQLSHFLFMMLISGVLSQFLQIYIRNLITNTGGIHQAGFWEAINRISSNYMLFISTLLSIYYYPKLINALSIAETSKVIRNYYKNIVPLFLIGAIVVFFVKDYLVQLLFTEEFKPVSRLFFWQLIGDFFKTISWILGFQFLAKKMTKEYLFFEFLSFGLLFLSSVYFVDLYQVEGAVIAFAVSYFGYWIVLSVFFRKILL